MPVGGSAGGRGFGLELGESPWGNWLGNGRRYGILVVNEM